MNATAPTGPQPTDLPATDGHVVRPLFRLLQPLADTDGSDALALLAREIVAAAQRYLIAVQADPGTAHALCGPTATTGSPSVRANEHILQGALQALTVPDLNRDERDRIVVLARDAGRRAGMDHLTIGSVAA